ncbi:MAG: DnaJ domain [Gammaproteobacteria bacterium]|nr:DnaJ domain [Gammaproteobacteria bacterium]
MRRRASNSLLQAVQGHQAFLLKRLNGCRYAQMSYAVHVNELTPQRVEALHQAIQAYERQPFWRRWFMSRSNVRHQRRLLAFHYEKQLVDGLLANRYLASESHVKDFANWHRYTPKLGLWNRFTGAMRRVVGGSRRLRDYQAFHREIKTRLQVAIIAPPLEARFHLQAEVERLLTEQPGFEPYRILGLLTSTGRPDYRASMAAIKGAYRDLMQRHHPDKHKDHQAVTTSLVEDINQAYSILGCPQRRALWDKQCNSTSIYQKIIIELRQAVFIDTKIKEVRSAAKEMESQSEQIEAKLTDMWRRIEKMESRLAKQEETSERTDSSKHADNIRPITQARFFNRKASNVPLAQTASSEVISLEEDVMQFNLFP